MQVWNSPRFSRVRRLGTSSAPGSPFGTTHVYYWRALGGWEPYSQVRWTPGFPPRSRGREPGLLGSLPSSGTGVGAGGSEQGGWEPGLLGSLAGADPSSLCPQPFTESIEAALWSGQQEALCSTAEHSYQLNLQAGYQRNLATGTLRPLRARSSSSNQHPLTSPPWASPGLVQPLPVRQGQMEGCPALTTSPHSPPRARARTQESGVFPCRKQSHMSRQMSPEQRLRNERHLFHGTAAGAVPAICKHNLDPRLSGKHAAIYGQGSYFARRASYSHRYAPPAEAGLRHVFLCKVLVGRSALGQPALRRPPPLDPSDPASDLYDSCVDSLSDPQIYVVFDNDQCYPYFLLQYRELEEVVKVD
uniref:Poly [ADP-ribose] polymerase n=1 Tax=Chrysemys picta bellii TaxID=8478 RepID=A0A8C3HCV2_CHRPI